MRAVIALLVLGSVAHAEAPSSGPEIIGARVGPSVVRLADIVHGEEVGHGSGFFVADGIVVTNHHVIEDISGDLVCVFADQRKVDVLGVIADDEAHDLALLRVRGTGYPTLPLADAATIHVGQRVIAVGSPLGFDQTVSSGIVSAVREGYPADLVKLDRDLENKRGPLLQHTAPIAPGSSGGPLVDDDGKVVGVNHSKFGGATELNFAAHVDALKGLLSKTKLDASPKRLGPDVRRNLFVSAGIALLLVVAFLLAARYKRI
jgi:serine protease Do